jgi:hypothetical protein
MKQLTILLSSLFLALLFNACASKPILKQYVPNEKVKTVYVTKDIPHITKNSISNQYPDTENQLRADISRPSSLKISSLYYKPNPLLTNKAFDFICKFKLDIPQLGENTVPVVFYFKVYRDSKVVFTSEEYIIDTRNNTNKEWIQHMNPFSKKRVYKFEAFIRYNNLFDRKSINVTVE